MVFYSVVLENASVWNHRNTGTTETGQSERCSRKEGRRVRQLLEGFQVSLQMKLMLHYPLIYG